MMILNEVVRGWSEGGQKGGQKDDVYRTLTEPLQNPYRK